MRFKSEIWEYWRKLEEEQQLNEYRKERGGSFLPLTSDMDEAGFLRLLNTYRWLSKFINQSRMDEILSKPTTDNLLEAIQFMEAQGADLLTHAKRHQDTTLRKALIKKARKRLDCVSYYKPLIESGFFNDQEVQLEQEEKHAFLQTD